MRRSIAFWLAALVVVAALSSALTRAQGAKPDPNAGPDWDPRIVTGSDLGFRIEGTDRDGNPTGTLVVRIKGKWFDASSAVGVRRVK